MSKLIGVVLMSGLTCSDGASEGAEDACASGETLYNGHQEWKVEKSGVY